jgi:hypothetical protein
MSKRDFNALRARLLISNPLARAKAAAAQAELERSSVEGETRRRNVELAGVMREGRGAALVEARTEAPPPAAGEAKDSPGTR